MYESKTGSSERKSCIIKRHSSLLTERHQGWLAGLPAHLSPAVGDTPCIIAIGGGKGGVGKSIVSANVSAKLAQMGFRVLAIDLDLGCANLHTHFGIVTPDRTLADHVLYRSREFYDVVIPTAIPNLGIAAGGREEAWATYLERGPGALAPIWEGMLRARTDMGVDFIVIDLGAGTHRNTIEFFAAAHLGIVTVLPEPTSIENAYVFMRTLLWQLIQNVNARFSGQDGIDDIRAAFLDVKGSFQSGYFEALRKCSAAHQDLVGMIFNALKGRVMGLVVNQVRSQADIDIGQSMEHISRRYFGYQASDLGYLNYEDAAWKSLRNRRLLVTDFPHCLLSKHISKVAVRALGVLGYHGG